MAKASSEAKQRRTFTLSPESLSYLEQEARRRSIDSQSAVLDELLREKKREQQLAAIDKQITAYYDSLTDEQVEEQRTWGEFAEQQLALTDEETSHGNAATRGDMVREI